MTAFKTDMNEDGVKFFKKAATDATPLDRKTDQSESLELGDKSAKPGSDSPKDKSDNRGFQLAQLLNQLPTVDGQKVPITPLLMAVVNELVQWKSIQDGKGVDVKVKDLPLRMVLTRVEGKLNLVLYAAGELKKELNEHHKELVALLKKKDIDLSGLNVLELGDYVKQPSGSGNRHSGQQSRNSDSEKSLVQFDTLMKGDHYDITTL